MKKWIIPVVIVAAGAAGFAVYQKQHADRQPETLSPPTGAWNWSALMSPPCMQGG